MSFLTTSADEVYVCLTCVVRIPPTAYPLREDLWNKIAVFINNNNNFQMTHFVAAIASSKRQSGVVFLSFPFTSAPNSGFIRPPRSWARLSSKLIQADSPADATGLSHAVRPWQAVQNMRSDSLLLAAVAFSLVFRVRTSLCARRESVPRDMYAPRTAFASAILVPSTVAKRLVCGTSGASSCGTFLARGGMRVACDEATPGLPYGYEGSLRNL